jgi:hypothetical protein
MKSMWSGLASRVARWLTISPYRLSKLLGDVVISQGGVVPHIDPALLPTKSGCVTCLWRNNIDTDPLHYSQQGQEGWCLTSKCFCAVL